MERARPPIDITSLSETLNTRVVACHDETAGRGYRALLGQGAGNQPTEITVFPDTGVVHIATDLADLILRRAELKASMIENELVIEIWGTTETSWAGTMVYRNGGVVFTTTRQRSEPGPPVFTAPESCLALPAASEAGEQPRIALSGRIGAQPYFRTTTRGTDILGFPLAVHDQPGETQWHAIRVFGERARALRNSLRKGQQVEVVGYTHLRERTRRTSETETREEVYAAAVREVDELP